MKKDSIPAGLVAGVETAWENVTASFERFCLTGADRGAVPLHHPLRQIAQSPANHAVHSRDRAILDKLSQLASLPVIDAWSLARRLAVRLGQPHSECLQTDPTGASTLAPQAAVIDQSADSRASSRSCAPS
jgi:hypothetical protein